MKNKKTKLPSLFKKRYTEKKLNKKIYKKIFIEDDKKFVKKFFEKTGTKGKKEIPIYSIPRDKAIDKKDQKRLFQIAKSIKKQKGRIKFGPIIACLVFIALVGVTVTFTKNIVCRKIITKTCESAFEAKCDIGYLNFSFLDSSFTMKNFEVANKKEPMTDLFSIENLVIDFSFPQLLRAHFVVEDFSVLGIETGKQRTYSGDLTAKKIEKIEKKKAKKEAKKAKQSSTLPVIESIKQKTVGVTTEEITSLFNQYNPQAILENCYAQLQTPAASDEVKAAVAKINDEWKEKPAQINTKIESVKTSVNKATSYDFSAIGNNPVKIKEAIDVINNALNDVKSLQNESQKLIDEFQATTKDVTDMSTKLNNAIKHDKDFASSEIKKITSFKLSDSKKLLSRYFDKLGYSLMGKYYPYAYQGINKLLEVKDSSKNNSKDKSKSKQKSVIGTRAPGRNVYFKGDTTPRFWIKKASGSGMGIALQATNISSDMDALGKPAVVDFTMAKNKIDHKAKLVVDCRSNSTDPLISADYSCAKLPLALPASVFGDGKGVPSFDSTSTLAFNASIYNAEGFTLTGTGNFNNLKITAEPFEPEYASKIYSSVLSKITSMKLDVTAGYTNSDGLIMNITSDADKKFANALVSEMNDQLTAVKNSAEKELMNKISELSGGALGELNSYDDIKNKMSSYQKTINEMSSKLEAKRKEAENKLKEQTNEKVNEAKNQAAEAASNSLKGLFGR